MSTIGSTRLCKRLRICEARRRRVAATDPIAVILVWEASFVTLRNYVVLMWNFDTPASLVAHLMRCTARRGLFNPMKLPVG